MAEPESDKRLCPFCMEEVKIDAVRCKHCQAAISVFKPAHGGICPFCKETIHPEAIRCKHCKANLAPAAAAAGFPEPRFGGFSNAFQRACPAPRRMRVPSGRPGGLANAVPLDPSGCPTAIMEGSSLWCLDYVEIDLDRNQTYCVYSECGYV